MTTAMTKGGGLKVTARGEREIVMTRLFDAPRELVFAAFTVPELVQRWLLGPPGWMMPVCEIDLRVGGRYRYLWRNMEGVEMGASGTFREIRPPDRIVHTENFDEPWYPGESTVTTELTDKGGKTLLTVTLLYVSKAARDGVLKSPMEGGVAQSYDRLDELLGHMPRPDEARATFS
jgi:uncharacterized protein YndB with AHSA1/START domain